MFFMASIIASLGSILFNPRRKNNRAGIKNSIDNHINNIMDTSLRIQDIFRNIDKIDSLNRDIIGSIDESILSLQNSYNSLKNVSVIQKVDSFFLDNLNQLEINLKFLLNRRLNIENIDYNMIQNIQNILQKSIVIVDDMNNNVMKTIVFLI